MVIGGAGPVAMVCAIRLCRAGISVLVLEAEEELNKSPRAMVYSGPSVIELKRTGILPDARKGGVVATRIDWRKLSGEKISGFKRDNIDDQAENPVVLGQYDLELLILRHLEKYKHIFSIKFSHRVVDIDQSNKNTVHTLVETLEGRKTFTSRYVLGCDGGRSTIREKILKLPFDGMTYDRWIVATNIIYPIEKYGWSTANFVVDRDNFALIAQISNTPETTWRCSYADDGSLSREELLDRVQMKLERLLPGPRPQNVKLISASPYRLNQRCTSAFKVGRVLLAGDSAHLCNPFGGMLDSFLLFTLVNFQYRAWVNRWNS